ncbi:MAG: type II toxin-antitoxin system VapC family toxin [Candidatus Binatia bacterium]
MVLDTSVYVGWLNQGLHAEWLLGPGVVRCLSAVVLMELRVGATTRRARRAVSQLVRPYETSGRLVAPSARLFDEAAIVLQRLRMRGLEVRRASLVNDVLIALTARAMGATVVTANAADFQAIRDFRRFSLHVIEA